MTKMEMAKMQVDWKIEDEQAKLKSILESIKDNAEEDLKKLENGDMVYANISYATKGAELYKIAAQLQNFFEEQKMLRQLGE